MYNKMTILTVAVALLIAGCKSDRLADDFASPPSAMTTGVYWYWMADNISKEGVVNDLKAMKQAGINSVFIGNIDGQGAPYGTVKLFSDEWWEALHTAMKTAADLDIEVGMFNCPGWSHTGGPWIKTEQAMRNLVSSETRVKGGERVKVKLPVPQSPTHFKAWSEDFVNNEGQPSPHFQDVRTLAFPVPENYRFNLFDISGAVVTTSGMRPKEDRTPYCLTTISPDSPLAARYISPVNREASVTLKLPKPQEARSLSIYPASHLQGEGELQIKLNNEWKSVATFPLNRANPFMSLGFLPFAPITVAFDKVTADEYRVAFRTTWRDGAVGEIVLSPTAEIDRYAERTLGRVTSAWTKKMIPAKGTSIKDGAPEISPAQVTDLTDRMQTDGTLVWDAPEGEWIVLRMGMTPIEIHNSPAAPEGTGLEMDKLSAEYIPYHFDNFLGEVLRRIPEEDRRTFGVAIIDSWEKGGQSFTDGFADSMRARYGYDPTPYLPLFTGYLIGSQDEAERFLWDVRRLSAEMLGNSFIRQFSRTTHEHGIRTWMENYGEEFTGEFLLFGKHADHVGGEFWMGGTEFWNSMRFIDVAASCAHIYNKPRVYAESFTSRDGGYVHHPRSLKRSGDAALAAGMTRSVLHVYISQSDEVSFPGIQTWFGIEFNRKNTWFRHTDLFTDYLKRCGVMLEHGLNVADVAYFIGEETPMAGGPLRLEPIKDGVTIPVLPDGYAADYVNSDVILNSMSVNDGRIVLPHGSSYRILVLPPFETMRPEVLKSIERLVADGATVLGDAPLSSPSLQNYPEADNEVKAIAAKIWGDGQTKRRTYNKGTVLSGMTIEEALAAINLPPDVKTETENVVYNHRSSADREIYFIANQNNRRINISPSFRVVGRRPELWNPVTGGIRPLPAFEQHPESTKIPLQLEPYESVFIVFSGASGKPQSADVLDNFPQQETAVEINTPWTVTFESDRVKRGPSEAVIFDKLHSWTENSDNRIRYYSGAAVYKNTFTLETKPSGKLYIDFDTVYMSAKVKLNGKYVGGVWTPPYRLEVTEAIHKGENRIEIEVVNTWVNRLIGDSSLPKEERVLNLYNNQWKPTSKLQQAGVTGKVRVMRE
jgi:hypothetical protein